MSEQEVKDDVVGDEQASSQVEERPDPKVLSEAKQFGWVPKEDFRGDPEDWIDAKAFVKRGREINSILRKNNERLQGQLSQAQADLQELKLTAKEFGEQFAQMRDNAYKRAVADLKAQRREAIKSEDHELADQLEERIDGLKEEAEKSTKSVERPVEPAKPDMTEYNGWLKENKWYDPDSGTDLFDYAEATALRIRREDPGLRGREFLDEITRRVKRKFPEEFEDSRARMNGSPVDGGGTGGRSGSKGKKTYESLPSDAKAACDRFVKQGIMKREDYVANYEWE